MSSVLLAKTKALVPVFVDVIRISSEREQIRSGGIRHVGSPRHVTAEPKTENAAHEELFNYLLKLSYEQRLILQAVMYIGRDERDPEDVNMNDYYDRVSAEESGVFDSPQKKIFDHMRHLESLELSSVDSVGHIASKGPLHNYLERGMKILNIAYSK